jgi:hypothetical protein
MVCFAAMTIALLDAFLFCEVCLLTGRVLSDSFPFSGDNADIISMVELVSEAATAFLGEEPDRSLLV